MARGKNMGYDFLDGMIINILRESPKPLQPLGISFVVNEKSKRLVGFNIIKRHLDFLVAHKKIFKGEIVENDNKIVVYCSEPMH